MQYNALDMEGNKDKMMETTNEERLSVHTCTAISEFQTKSISSAKRS